MNNELMHYGVLGMKWGVHRAIKMQNSLTDLQKRALKFDKKKEQLYKKAEKQHSQLDLKKSNIAAKKAAKYSIKSIKLQKKAADSDDIRKLKKASRYDLIAAKYKLKANQLSLSKGYGHKSIKTIKKADKQAIKSAKIRKKIETNKYYIEARKKKLKKLSPEERSRMSDLISKLGKEKF